MEDAICSLSSGGAATFYADNCGEVFNDYLMLLVPNTYVQIRAGQCGQPYYTTVQQPLLDMDAFIGAGRGVVGSLNGGTSIVACPGLPCTGTFPSPIADPTGTVALSSGSGSCSYTTLYVRYAFMAADGALTSAQAENSDTASGTCLQATLPAAPGGTATGSVTTSGTTVTLTGTGNTPFRPGVWSNGMPINICLSGSCSLLKINAVATETSLTVTTTPPTCTTLSPCTYYGPNAAIYACSGSCAGNETFQLYAALTNSSTNWNIPTLTSGNGFQTTNLTASVFLLTGQSPALSTAQFGEQLYYWSIDCNGVAANAVGNRMAQETSDVGWINARNCPGIATATAPYIIEGNNGTAGANNMAMHDLTVDIASSSGSICASKFGGTQGYPCNPGSGLGSSVVASGTVTLAASSPYTGTLSFTTGSVGNLRAGYPIMFYVLPGDGGSGNLSFIINTINPTTGCTAPCLTLGTGTGTTQTQNVPSGAGGSYHWAYTNFSGAGFYDAIVSSSRGLNGMTITPNSGPTQYGIEVQTNNAAGTLSPTSSAEFMVKNVHTEGGQGGITNNSFAFQYALDVHGNGSGSIENVNTSSTTNVAVVHLASDATNWTLTDIAPHSSGGPPPLQDDVDSSCAAFPALGAGVLAAGATLAFASIGPAACEYYLSGSPVPCATLSSATGLTGDVNISSCVATVTAIQGHPVDNTLSSGITTPGSAFHWSGVANKFEPTLPTDNLQFIDNGSSSASLLNFTADDPTTVNLYDEFVSGTNNNGTSGTLGALGWSSSAITSGSGFQTGTAGGAIPNLGLLTLGTGAHSAEGGQIFLTAASLGTLGATTQSWQADWILELSSVTNIGARVGFYAQAMTPTAVPANGFYLCFDTSAGCASDTTHWNFCVSSTSTETCGATSQTPSSSAFYRVRFTNVNAGVPTSGFVQMTLYNSAGSQLASATFCASGCTVGTAPPSAALTAAADAVTYTTSSQTVSFDAFMFKMRGLSR